MQTVSLVAGSVVSPLIATVPLISTVLHGLDVTITSWQLLSTTTALKELLTVVDVAITKMGVLVPFGAALMARVAYGELVPTPTFPFLLTPVTIKEGEVLP